MGVLKGKDENNRDPDLLVRGADPDPYQNVTDPQLSCFFKIILMLSFRV